MGLELRLRVFENRVLRRESLGLRGTGEWRKLHNEGFNDLYSPNVIQVIKLRRMRWTGRVAVVERGGVYRVWWGNLRKRDYLEDLGISGKIILRWIFRKWDGGNGLDWSGAGWGQVAGTF
jgi:hypothetical protein